MSPEETPGPNRPGEIALSMGIIACLFSLVPIIGDVVAAVAGPLALVLGAIGVRRSEQGVATNFGPSLVGATLGALAIMVVALMFAVAR
jgi:hypothetical protein